jgi:hypothetical protein
MLHRTIHQMWHTTTHTHPKYNLKRHSRRPNGTRHRNRTTQNNSRKHNISNIQRNIRTIMSHPTNQPTTITQKIQSKRTRELLLYNRRKHCNTISRGGTFTCDYHPKTKIPTIFCITDKNKNATYKLAASTLAQQPSYKGRKRVIDNETNNTITPAAYISNLKTAQQELLCLREKYAHADMKEIHHQIGNCEIKANGQVTTCQIHKCLSCCENKAKKISHKKHRGSITQGDSHSGPNTSIYHVYAANVPGYTWQHKGRPTLQKYTIFMLFVDHKTHLVYCLYFSQIPARPGTIHPELRTNIQWQSLPVAS